MNIVLWIIQGVLGVAFLMAGFMKISKPKEFLSEKVGGWVDDFADSTIKLIGVVEVLGAVGLVFPMLFGTVEILTLFAAGGLATTMVLAAATHIRRRESFIPNIALFLLSLSVLIGRIYLIPIV